ncbi:MAG: tripartite tricarboxylate transporter substrate binding protein [Betaproteobacteria bacterium]|nr:tripartite tricarboxylate transporter substrate binding protein [Betaproteobacteria bacterium]MDH3437104.1 tripartite tricarboxylate transporter substrate binding protein [Betaproteobacteria bacterium]
MRAINFVLVLLLGITGSVFAQIYPAKKVTVIVPFSAGGSVDLVARTLGKRMSEIWRQPVIIVNRPGASGNIGAELVSRATPDGYTLLCGSTALSISPSSYKKLSYDVLKDLAPISQLVATPNLLVVHPVMPAKSVRELVALAKAKPDLLTAASAGAGTSAHFSLELFKSMAGVKITHIPYKGAAPSAVAVVGGEVDMALLPIVAVVPLVKAGKLRALGVTTLKRSPALPGIPTISEAGVKGYEAASWSAMLAPAGTPRRIIDIIHAAIVDAFRSSQVKSVLSRLGGEPIGSSPDEFARALRAEIAKWRDVAKRAGIKPR